MIYLCFVSWFTIILLRKSLVMMNNTSGTRTNARPINWFQFKICQDRIENWWMALEQWVGVLSVTFWILWGLSNPFSLHEKVLQLVVSNRDYRCKWFKDPKKPLTIPECFLVKCPKIWNCGSRSKWFSKWKRWTKSFKERCPGSRIHLFILQLQPQAYVKFRANIFNSCHKINAFYVILFRVC